MTTPKANFDSPWKEALARYLSEAFALFFPEAHAAIDWKLAFAIGASRCPLADREHPLELWLNTEGAEHRGVNYVRQNMLHFGYAD